MEGSVQAADRFRHTAMFYSSWPEFIHGTIPFLREGIAAGEPVLVVETPHKIRLLRMALENDAGKVLFADMSEVGANPARIIPAWRDFVDRHGMSGKAMRGIGEPIWSGRTDDELVECQRHESLLNVAFAPGLAWSLLCPYDTSALEPAVIDEARRSHEFVIDRGVLRESDQFRGVEACAAPFSAPLPPKQNLLSEAPFTVDDLHLLRSRVATHARASGLDEARTAGLVTAVNEVATNSTVYGGGKGSLRIWQDANDLICEIRDGGMFDRPLVDRELRGSDPSSPRGLWVANQLCDLVQIRTFPNATAVRLHMRIDPKRKLRVMRRRSRHD